MEATGVPTHIQHSEEIRRLRDDIEALTNTTTQGLSEFKDDLHASLNDLQRTTEKKLNEQADSVVTGILSNCEVNGAIPLTQQSQRSMSI